MLGADKFSVERIMSEVLDARSIVDKLTKSEALDNIMYAYLMEVYSAGSAGRVRSKVIPDLRPRVVENLRKCVERSERASELEEPLKEAGLDLNWMIAAICFAVQDASVKKTANRLGISLSYIAKGKTRHKNAKQLMEDIEKLAKGKDERTRTIALRVAQQWNIEFRNGVIHDGQLVTEKESRRILDVTNDLLNELSAIVS